MDLVVVEGLGVAETVNFILYLKRSAVQYELA